MCYRRYAASRVYSEAKTSRQTDTQTDKTVFGDCNKIQSPQYHVSEVVHRRCSVTAYFHVMLCMYFTFHQLCCTFT